MSRRMPTTLTRVTEDVKYDVVHLTSVARSKRLKGIEIVAIFIAGKSSLSDCLMSSFFPLELGAIFAASASSVTDIVLLRLAFFLQSF